jgi:hypothetical protein
MWHHNHAAAYGACLILALSSGLAIGWGTVIERFTTAGEVARSPAAVVAGRPDWAWRAPAAASEAQSIASFTQEVPPWFDKPSAATGTLFTHVVDRPYEEPAGATTRTPVVADP